MSTAEGMLHLLAAEPTLLPEALADTSAAAAAPTTQSGANTGSA